jgi:hypothetical protein
MWAIINYFNNIDNLLFNNNGPSWLLNKNKTTIFLNYKEEHNVEYINVCYTIPYEFEFFFFFLLFYIYWSMCNIYINNNLYSQPHLNEFYFLLDIIKNNFDFFWILNKICFDLFKFTNYTVNPNSIYGIELESNTWSYLWTYKYKKIDKLRNYLNLLNLDYYQLNYYNFYIPSGNIINNYLIILIFFLIIFIIKQIKIKFILFINNLKKKKKKLFYKKNNLNIVWAVFTHYNFKFHIWNNYLKNK